MTDTHNAHKNIRAFLNDNTEISRSVYATDPDEVVYPEGKNKEEELETIFVTALNHFGNESIDDTQELNHLIVAIAGRATRGDASEDFRSAVEQNLDIKIAELEEKEDHMRLSPLERLRSGLSTLRNPEEAIKKMRNAIQAAEGLHKNPGKTKNQKPGLN